MSKASTLKAMYQRINLSQVNHPGLVTQLEKLAERSSNFTNEVVCEAEESNLKRLYSLVETKFPAAIKGTVKDQAKITGYFNETLAELKKNHKQHLASLIRQSDDDTSLMLKQIREMISVAYKAQNTALLELLNYEDELVTEARGKKLDAEVAAQKPVKKGGSSATKKGQKKPAGKGAKTNRETLKKDLLARLLKDSKLIATVTDTDWSDHIAVIDDVHQVAHDQVMLVHWPALQRGDYFQFVDMPLSEEELADDVQAPAIKQLKNKPATPQGSQKPATAHKASVSADSDALEWCRAAIQTSLQQKKDQKLKDWKAEKIAKLEEDKGLSPEEFTEKRDKVEATSYADAFGKHRSITEEVGDAMFGVFKKVINVTAQHIAKTGKLDNGKKPEKFAQTGNSIQEWFVTKMLPELHKKFLGDRSDRFIEDFNKKANSLLTEKYERLENKYNSKSNQKAA